MFGKLKCKARCVVAIFWTFQQSKVSGCQQPEFITVSVVCHIICSLYSIELHNYNCSSVRN